MILTTDDSPIPPRLNSRDTDQISEHRAGSGSRLLAVSHSWQARALSVLLLAESAGAPIGATMLQKYDMMG